MADITMCKGDGCKRKETCYRYTAPKTPHWQSYFGGAVLKEDGSCCYYVKTGAK